MCIGSSTTSETVFCEVNFTRLGKRLPDFLEVLNVWQACSRLFLREKTSWLVWKLLWKYFPSTIFRQCELLQYNRATRGNNLTHFNTLASACNNVSRYCTRVICCNDITSDCRDLSSHWRTLIYHCLLGDAPKDPCITNVTYCNNLALYCNNVTYCNNVPSVCNNVTCCNNFANDLNCCYNLAMLLQLQQQ